MKNISLHFWGALRSECTKLLSLTSTYVLLILNMILLPVGGALGATSMKLLSEVSSSPTIEDAVADAGATVGALDSFLTPNIIWTSAIAAIDMSVLIVGIFGVMSLTSEYVTSSVVATFTADPRRWQVMCAKLVSVFAFSTFSSLIGLVLSGGISYAILSPVISSPLEPGYEALPYVTIIGGALALGLMAVFALGLGGVCRSTLGGIFSFIGIVIILPSVLGLVSFAGPYLQWVSNMAEYMPNSLIKSLVYMNTGDSGSVVWWLSAILLAVWAAAAWILGSVVVDRTDIK